MEMLNRVKRMLVAAAAGALLVAPVATSLTSAPAQAQQSASSLSDYCGQSIGYSPFCNTIAGVPVTGKGYKPGSNKTSYCYQVWNSEPKAIVAGAEVVGKFNGKTHKVYSGKYGTLCAKLPAGQCPRINLFWVNGDMANNLGTFPSCHTTWQLPNKKHPSYRQCKKNTGTTRMWLDLYKGKTLSEENFAAPGKTACVSLKITAKHPQARVSVLAYHGRGTSFSTKMVQETAVIHWWG